MRSDRRATYKTKPSRTGIKQYLRLLLNICFFLSSSPWNLGLSKRAGPCCRLRIDLRRRFQNPGLLCEFNASNSELESSPSSSSRKASVERSFSAAMKSSWRSLRGVDSSEPAIMAARGKRHPAALNSQTVNHCSNCHSRIACRDRYDFDISFLL